MKTKTKKQLSRELKIKVYEVVYDGSNHITYFFVLGRDMPNYDDPRDILELDFSGTHSGNVYQIRNRARRQIGIWKTENGVFQWSPTC